MSKVDVTDRIERLEILEEKLDVTLESLSVFIDDETSDSPYVSIHGELLVRNGTELSQDIWLIAAVYDTSGRVIQTSSEHFDEEDFFEFDIFEMNMYLPTNDLSKIRIYPKKS